MGNPKLEPTPAVPRPDPDRLAGEAESLRQWLDFHRATFRLKCAGLDDAQLARRPLPSTTLSLLGLMRHLTEVERGWFAGTLAGQDATPVYYGDDDPDGDFDRLDSHPVAEVEARYLSAVEESRAVLAGFGGPDELSRNPAEPTVTLRWVLMHLVEEYARHNGHADLVRQAVDGAVGE